MKPPRIYGAELMTNPAFENLKMNSMTPCWQVHVACSLSTGNMFKLPCSSFPANGMNLILTELLVMYRKTMRTTLLTGTPWTVKSVLMLIFDLVHYQFLCTILRNLGAHRSGSTPSYRVSYNLVHTLFAQNSVHCALFCNAPSILTLFMVQNLLLISQFKIP